MTSPVGRNVPVIDAVDRVTGALEFTLDVELPGMLYARFVRSPVAHARIVRIDISDAMQVPGVLMVMTGAELGKRGLSPGYGRVIRDQAILATDRVRYVGEPIAAVLAVSEYAAENAAHLVDLDYEELPAVFDTADALRDDAILLYETRPPLQPGFEYVVRAPSGPSNVCSEFRLRHGNVDSALNSADFVFDDTFCSPPVQHVALEPHVAVARYTSQGLTVWSSTQMPNAIRAQLAAMFLLDLTRVRVIVSNLGGGFGSKGSLRVEPIVAALSMIARRPVKMTLSREEEFVTTTKHGARIRIRTGVNRDGYMVARHVVADFNTGAYADVGPVVARNAGSAMSGPYFIPHVLVESRAILTNLVSAGAFRGFGVSQGAWAYESQMDMIADRLRLDPLEFRRLNVLRNGQEFATGEVMDHSQYDRLLDTVASSIGWYDDDAGASVPTGRLTRRAKAVTTVIKATVTPSTSTASVMLNDDGTLNVLTSSVDMGQGAKTVLAQLAAEALHMPYGRVSVSSPDTALTPYDQQTSSSRTTYCMGQAVTRAAHEVRDQLALLASSALEIPPDALEFNDGVISVRGTAASRITYADAVRSARRGNLLGSGEFRTEGTLDLETGQGIGSVHWHQGAVGCEVEVDLETGRITICKIVSAIFAGRVVNPRLCELQVEGSMLFGLGQALFEEMIHEEGQPVNTNLSDYMIPSFDDLPTDVVVCLLEDGESAAIHGVGETCLPPIMPAVANAVARAAGVRVTELPVTPERILRALHAAPHDAPATDTRNVLT